MILAEIDSYDQFIQSRIFNAPNGANQIDEEIIMVKFHPDRAQPSHDYIAKIYKSNSSRFEASSTFPCPACGLPILRISHPCGHYP